MLPNDETTEIVVQGRPRKISLERLYSLMELRVQDQMTWSELAEWYEEEFGESVTSVTIRRAMLKDAPMNLIPMQVSQQAKEAIEKIQDGVDILQIIVILINARFGEWMNLYNDMIRAHLSGLAPLEEGEEPEKFDSGQQARMDLLNDNITSFFFRYQETMRQLEMGDSAGFMMWTGNHPGVPSLEVDGDFSISKLMSEMADRTQGMMERIKIEHQAQERGEYRVIEAEEDEFEVLE